MPDNLYHLTGRHMEALSSLEDLLSSDDAAAIDAALAEFENVEAAIDDKLTAYCYALRHLDDGVLAAKREEERIYKIRKSKLAAINSLKNRMSNTLRVLDVQKKDLGLFKVGFRKSKAAVKITGEVPPEFLVAKYDPDKTKIAEFLKSNEVSWASMEGGEYLSIT